MNIKCKEFGRLVSEKYQRMHEQSKRIYSPDGLSPTIHTMQGGNTEIKVAIMNSNIKPICLNSKGGRGGVEGLQPSLTDRVYDSNGISTAITTSPFFMPNYITKGGNTDLKVAILKENLSEDTSKPRIRKLTPKECWRLMGFDDVDFDKAEKVCSNTQLYKQAGNSIVVNVLEGILGALIPKPSRSAWLDELLGEV